MAWIQCIVYDGMAFLPMRVKDGLKGGGNSPGRCGTDVQEQ